MSTTPDRGHRVIPLRPVSEPDEVSRRTFVKLLGATMLAAGGVACAQPGGEIVPYVRQPPEVVPGIPLHFATAMELGGFATGLVAESREGRPVKIEGNPLHPASLGAAGVFEQAAILQLYDPDRGRYITRRGAPVGWIDVRSAFDDAVLRQQAGAKGAGLALLLEPTASPMTAELLARVQTRYPQVRIYFHAPLVNDAASRGAAQVLGRPAQAIYDFTQADVVVAVDADPMGAGPFHLRYARQLADRRRVRQPSDAMSRLYAIEGRYTPTGIASDHRLAVRPSEIPALLAALLREVGVERAAAHVRADASGATSDFVRAVGRDLADHRGRAVVVVGDRQPALAHALGCAINQALGAIGTHVRYVDPLLLPGDGSAAELAEAIRHGDVHALVVLGGNPSYDMPADLEFQALLRQVPLTLYSGLYANETSSDVMWYVPAAHFLESWGDARAYDGTASIVQPLIAPLNGGLSSVDLLAFLAGDDRASHDLVREFWQKPSRLGTVDEAWRDVLRRGVVPGPAVQSVDGRVSAAALAAIAAGVRPAEGALEIAFVEDACVYDGRFANNGWLQELPDPVSTVTWDNAAFVSHATAERLGVQAAQALTIESGGRRIQAPVFIEPGVADGLIVLPLGYGRQGAESVARDVGVNAYPLRPADGYIGVGVSARPALTLGVPLVHAFALTAEHWTLEGRPILLTADLAHFRDEPQFTAEHKGPVAALYGVDYTGPRQWAMAIDLTVCTGCNACMVACQAENNVPVVGKSGVQQHREMHWLRIDRYLTGATGRIAVQPMLCQQCEAAPCEYVCPVNATVHSPDGLNEMVYNRCVGTRFCSNNCPYKVRRFNWFNYTSEMQETEKMAMNPDVTVRARGVMEKCTFCVQRIRRAEIDAATGGSDQPFDALQTACQQACPTRAIVFGSIADPGAAVARDARADHSYHVLNELGTRPRISYLARLRNANPALPENGS